MYKKTFTSKEQSLSNGNAYMFPEYKIDHLIGRVLTLIDTLALTSSQDKAIKDLLKQCIREHIYDMPYVDAELAAVVTDAVFDKTRVQAQHSAEAQAEYESNTYTTSSQPAQDDVGYELTMTIK